MHSSTLKRSRSKWKSIMTNGSCACASAMMARASPHRFWGDGRAGHFGLHGMRERGRLVGGELAVWSELDSGTEVELSVPAANAYEKSSATRRSWLAEIAGKLSGKGTSSQS